MGLVLDEYDTAEAGGKQVRVENNVFLIPDVEYNAEVVVTGPAGRIAARPRGRTGGRLEPPRIPLGTGPGPDVPSRRGETTSAPSTP